MKRPLLIAVLVLGLAACNHQQPHPAAAAVPVTGDAEFTGITHYPRAYPVALPAKLPVAQTTTTTSAMPIASSTATPAIAAESPTTPSPVNANPHLPHATSTTPAPDVAPAGTSTSTYTSVPESIPASTNVAAAEPTPVTTPAATETAVPAVDSTSLPSAPTSSPATDTDSPSSTSDQVVVLDTTFGRIVIALDDFAAPKTCANFRKLVSNGFYNGTIFHRVIPQFIIQGGDPNTKTDNRMSYGQGDPGYTLPPEIKLSHDRGAVAMARLPDTVNPQHYSNGSQFYICVAACPSLDNQYTVFAHVIAGLDVADRIANVPADRRNDPIERIAIKARLEPRDRALRENASSGP